MKTRRMIGAGTAAAALLLTGAVAGPAFAATQTVTDLNDPSLTPETLAQQLVGDGTPITNVTYTGASAGAGLATGFEDVFGFDSGVVLSTGSVAGDNSSILGPNESNDQSTGLNVPGDADLDAIVAPQTTSDASVLEFEFTPVSDTVTFSYVFGSEEYEEYVNSQFNDVFGFFVNGTNYASVATDDGSVPVTINTINPCINTEFYVSNVANSTCDDGETEMPAWAPGDFNTELDGFTVVLSFEAPVTAGEINHIKLAIADAADDSLDSAVLIQAGSFKSNTAPTAADIAKETEFDTPIEITLQGDDADGDALTYSVLDAPAVDQGTLSALDGNKITFTPADGFTGDATFTYRVNDGSVNSAPATVTIKVLEEGVIIPTTTPTPTAPETTEPPVTPTPTETGTPTETETAVPTSTTVPTASEVPTTDSGEDLAKTGADDMGLLIGLSAALLLAGGAVFATTRLRRQF